jgi:protein SCO1
MVRAIALFSAAAVMLGIAAGFFFTFRGVGDDPFAPCRRTAVAGGTATIGGPFSLVDTEGRRVTEAEVITKPTLIYFGYSFCPDFCPMDLARNAEAAAAARGARGRGRPGLRHRRPARDTPEVLAGYTEHFHPDLVALRGSPEETKAAADAYRVYFQVRDGDDEFYPVDHSTFTYLMAPEHGFLEFFPSDASADAVAEAVGCFAERVAARWPRRRPPGCG